MAKTAILAIKIIGDSAGGVKALGDAETKTGKLAGGMKLLGGAAIAGGAALLAYGAKAVTAGGDLEQSIGAVDTVFKQSAQQMHAWGKSAATGVGLARNEFNELGTLIGTQLKNGGTAMDQLAPKTQELITLGADLSSMFGGSTADAVGALSSALKGERDPIERYGVSLNQAAIDAKAAELGFKKVGGALTTEANQAATLALIMAQTTDAHGNFAKESNTWNHQIQVLQAGFGSFTSELGLKLLPALTMVVSFIVGQLLPGFEQILGGVDPLLGMLGDLAAGFTGAGDQASPLAGILGQLAAWATGQLMPALQGLGATVMEVFGVVSGIIGTFATDVATLLAPLLPTVFEIFGTIGQIVTTAIDLIGAVIMLGLGAVQAFWNTWGQSILAMVGVVFAAVLGVIQPALNTIQAIIRTVLAVIRGDWEGAWNGLVDIANGFIATVSGIFNGAKDILVGAGKAIIDGFLRGLKGAWEGVKNFVGGIASWIANNKGPLSYDRRLLKPAGTAIMTGLVTSMRASMPQLAKVVGDATKMITGLDANPKIHLRATAESSSSRTAARPATKIEINLNGVIGDRIAIAREIKRVLKDHDVLVGA